MTTNKKYLPLILSFLFLGFIIDAKGQSVVSGIDVSYLYDTSKFGLFKSQSITIDSSSFIMLTFGLPHDSINKLMSSYFLVPSLDQKPKSIIRIKSMSALQHHTEFGYTSYGLKVQNKGNLFFVFQLEDTTTLNTWLFPIALIHGSGNDTPNVFLGQASINVPILSRNISVSTAVRVNSLFSPGHHYNVDFYDHHFLPATPPMANKEKPGNVPLQIDSTFTVSQLDTFYFNDPGLYYFHEPASKVGISMLAVPNYFPKPAKIQDLVESLVYIASSDEYEQLKSSFKQKKLFDEFWLNNTKSETKAKRSIKEYFRRVKNANILFTDYKEGWKTDMGMIYVIFGHPNRVFKNDKEEMWIYNKSFELPRISFIFKKVNTAFSNNYFVLDRRPELQLTWFRAVELWRKGKKEF